MSHSFASGPLAPQLPPPPPPVPEATMPGRDGGDPTKSLNLKWGTWRLRYALGLGLALLALGILMLYPGRQEWVLPAAGGALVVMILAAIVLPATRARRGVACLLAFLYCFVLAAVPDVERIIFAPILMGLLSAAWTTARSRHIISTLAGVGVSVVIALQASFSGWPEQLAWMFVRDVAKSTSYLTNANNVAAFLAMLLALTVAAWVATLVERKLRRSALAREARLAELRAGMPPSSNMYAGSSNLPLQTGTNTVAIVAIIAVFFVNIAGLILGHVALSQIKRTGEDGRGLALAAVIIGWISVAVSVVLVIWSLAIYSNMYTALINVGSY